MKGTTTKLKLKQYREQEDIPKYQNRDRKEYQITVRLNKKQIDKLDKLSKHYQLTFTEVLGKLIESSRIRAGGDK